MAKCRPFIWLVLVFVLGILCGSLAIHMLYLYRFESILSGRAQSREETIVNRLERKLDLDTRQEEQVKAIVHETQEKIKAVRRQIRPQTEAIIEKAQEKIRAILSTEQIKKYEQIIAARKENLRKRGF